MDLKITRIVNSTTCADHAAGITGMPCFHVPKLGGFGYFAGICGKRAKKAGMNGRVSPASLRLMRRG